MKSALLLAGLLITLSSTAALSQQETHKSTARRSTTAAKKQPAATKKSRTSSKKSAASGSTGSTTVASPSSTETMTSTPRREAPVVTQPTSVQTRTEMPAVVAERPIESWYGYYGIGYARPSYPGALETAASELRASSNVSNAGIAMDAAGVYTPYGGTKILVGGVVNFAIDTYIEGESSITLTQATVASSALYFVDRIGEGPFVRGDVGVAALSISNELNERLESPVGVGVLAGAGYAVPLSDGTGLMLNVNYSARLIDGETLGAFGATVGILF